jgi:hypothetical protein
MYHHSSEYYHPDHEDDLVEVEVEVKGGILPPPYNPSPE